MGKIRVHEKALAHLSRGLYRSPASALRELVSNAWDANATVLRISTNYPLFFQLAIEDNGVGFTKDDFVDLMEGGIGNSEKRSDAQPLINDRPVIGRLGIGMLGIAQITGAFTVTSKPKKGEGFRARVHLYDLLKSRLDRNDKSIMQEVAVEVAPSGGEQHLKEDQIEPVRIIDVGEYSFESYSPQDYKFGTLIVADDVHPTFVDTFQKSLNFEKFKRPPLDWSKALNIVSKVHSLQELGDYWRLLWELSAACPLPYLSDGAVPRKLIAEEQERLLAHNFKVIVDGIQLFKPVRLRDNPGGYTTRKIERVTRKIYGKNLVFHGYTVVQDGLSIRPDELRGILIRIKNVAIGYYDPSLLDYRFNEGPRSRWLTGEIFVDEGLEDALNIDRDSFNRFHPEYRAIQEYVHKVLQEEVFPDVYKQISKRSMDREISKEIAREERLGDVLSRVIKGRVNVREDTKASSSEQLPTVSISEKGATVEVVLPNNETIKTKRANRQLAAATLAIYEVAMRERTHSKQREVFTQLLLDLLARW